MTDDAGLQRHQSQIADALEAALVLENISSRDNADVKKFVEAANARLRRKIREARLREDAFGVPLWLWLPEPGISRVIVWSDDRKLAQTDTYREEVDTPLGFMAWIKNAIDDAAESLTAFAITATQLGDGKPTLLVSEEPKIYCKREAYQVELRAWMYYCEWRRGTDGGVQHPPIASPVNPPVQPGEQP